MVIKKSTSIYKQYTRNILYQQIFIKIIHLHQYKYECILQSHHEKKKPFRNHLTKAPESFFTKQFTIHGPNNSPYMDMDQTIHHTLTKQITIYGPNNSPYMDHSIHHSWTSHSTHARHLKDALRNKCDCHKVSCYIIFFKRQ